MHPKAGRLRRSIYHEIMSEAVMVRNQSYGLPDDDPEREALMMRSSGMITAARMARGKADPHLGVKF